MMEWDVAWGLREDDGGDNCVMPVLNEEREGNT